MANHRGSCLCGSIQFELHDEPGEFGYCQCLACQKASGSAHAANAPIERRDFRLLAGANMLTEFESSPGKFRSFCSRCGSPIYAYLTQSPETLRIRLGTLDTAFVKQPTAHTWVVERAPWAPITDDLPMFDRWAPRYVLHQKGSKQDRPERGGYQSQARLPAKLDC